MLLVLRRGGKLQQQRALCCAHQLQILRPGEGHILPKAQQKLGLGDDRAQADGHHQPQAQRGDFPGTETLELALDGLAEALICLALRDGRGRGALHFSVYLAASGAGSHMLCDSLTALLTGRAVDDQRHQILRDSAGNFILFAHVASSWSIS